MTKKQITFETVMDYVKRLGLEDHVTAAVINRARTIPPGSLRHFVDNINTYIANLTRETHGKTEQT